MFGGLDKTEVGFGLFDFQRKFKNLPDCLKINFRNHSIIGSFTPQKSTLEKLQGTWLTFFFYFWTFLLFVIILSTIILSCEFL